MGGIRTEMGLNRALIGKQYPAQDYGVTAEAVGKYARAYNEDNPLFFDIGRPHGVLAPPMFGVVMGWLPIMTVVTDSELNVDVLRLLHAEQDMRFVLPVVSGDIITSTASLVSIEEKTGGEAFTLAVDSTNQRGQAVQHMRFGAFIRGERRRGRGVEAFGPSPQTQPLLRVGQSIDPDQTYRYAEASGDHNPIHLDDQVARMAGLPGIIVHGLCTMAFTSKVMIDHLCDHEPRRLKRLRVRFSRPVFPGQDITTAVWQDPQQADNAGLSMYTYETYNPDGKAVIKDGVAEIAPAEKGRR